jgi:hypothetical protein
LNEWIDGVKETTASHAVIPKGAATIMQLVIMQLHT